MIFGRPPRAYALVDGRWCNIYTIRFYTQVDIFGVDTPMVACTLSAKGKEIHHIPVDKLESKRPKTSKSKSNEGA